MLKNRVKQLAEAEQLKFRETQNRLKAVSLENSLANITLQERQFRDRQLEVSQERDRLAQLEKALESERSRMHHMTHDNIHRRADMLGPSVTGVGMELSHREPYISPMRRKNEPSSVGEQFSAVKTKYWSKIENENNPKIPGPFVDLRETHRHQNRVQALLKKTE